jgi:putative flavoprotein involved in K+ transport
MMKISTVIVGAGQAGLAMSHCLSERSVPHVILERGEVANSWRRERWDSLRLLTPNWQSRLPGFAYSGPSADGFMSMQDVIAYLDDYAAFSDAPIEERTEVLNVTSDAGGYRIGTTRGEWVCENLVLATGACNVANVPACAKAAPAGLIQITALDYRNPDQLMPGGVLVVGASASGLQIAREIRQAGHEVILAVGEHIRMPRHYRGRDIQSWMDLAGVHSARTDEVEDIERARRLPSLQLCGSSASQFMDLNSLRSDGIQIAGRLADVRGGKALFSGSLANQCALSDLKMNRLLAQLDDWIEAQRWQDDLPPPERFAPTDVPEAPKLSLSLTDSHIRTIVWATGFRPDYSWLQLPVLDRKGRLEHRDGHVGPGLYALGLPFMRRRNSTLIDGVGKDAAELADHIATRKDRRAA